MQPLVSCRSCEERRSNELQTFIKKSDQEKKDLQKRLDDKDNKMSCESVFCLSLGIWREYVSV